MATLATQLLARVDPLPHPARAAVLARTALDLAGTPALDVLLDELFERGPWERVLSLRMAVVAAHLGHVTRCLDAGDGALALRAVGSAVRLGIEPQALVDRLAIMPSALRTALVAAVRAHRATGLAHALLEPLRELCGDREAAALLPACEHDVVVRELPSLAWAVAGWPALAGRHPDLYLDHVEAELAAGSTATRVEVVERQLPALLGLAVTRPARVLDVLETTGGRLAVSRLLAVLGSLARHDPARVLELVLSDRTGASPVAGLGHRGARTLWKALAVLDDDALGRLAARLRDHELVGLLHALPPRRRPAAYAAVADRDLGGLAPAVLDELPWRARHAEAARLLRRRAVAEQRTLRLEVTARLPFDEAEPLLRTATRAPLAEDRAAGWSLLVVAVRATRDPVRIESVLTSADRLLNEQDPVRGAALDAVAAVPTWLLSDTAAAGVVRQCEVAVQARDISGATAMTVRRIAVRLVAGGHLEGRPSLVELGLSALRDAAGNLQHVALADLAGQLPPGTEQGVLEALRPRLTSDARLGRHDVLLRLAASLGQRAWGLEAIDKRLAAACRASSDDVVRRAITLWLAPPATRDARVEVVLRRDRSTIVVDAVERAVTHRRTDLLHLVLDRRPRGRFATRGVWRLPSVPGHGERWVPRQVERYRDLALDVVEDRGRSVWERSSMLRVLARLPGGLAPARAHLDDPEPQLAVTALAALAWTADPARVVPDLVARADGDLGHVAVAALGRCARFVAPAELAVALRGLLTSDKVTARKEACRLLAQHRVPGAAAVLASVVRSGGPGAAEHRDVRRAAVSALRDLLDDPESWAALTAAAGDPETATAVLAVAPGQVAPAHRARYALLVLAVAEQEDPDTSVLGWSAAADWVPWVDGDSDVVVSRAADRLVDLDDVGPRWRHALSVVLARSRRDADPAVLLGPVESLVESHRLLDLDPAHDAVAERDLPARQRLALLVSQWSDDLTRTTDAWALAAPVVDRLAGQPLLGDLAVRLLAAGLAWDDDGVVEQLGRLVTLAEDPGAGAGAVETAEAVRAVLTSRAGTPEATVLHRLAAAAREDPRPTAGLIDLALLEVAAQRLGWSEELRARLRALRRHPDLGVRRRAVRLTTARE